MLKREGMRVHCMVPVACCLLLCGVIVRSDIVRLSHGRGCPPLPPRSTCEVCISVTCTLCLLKLCHVKLARGTGDGQKFASRQCNETVFDCIAQQWSQTDTAPPSSTPVSVLFRKVFGHLQTFVRETPPGKGSLR